MIIRDLFPNSIKIVFVKCLVWMKESSIFDLRFGFCVNNYLYGQLPRSEIDHPGQNMRNFPN